MEAEKSINISSGRYILKDKKPVYEPDIMKWGKWFEKEDRHVDKIHLVDVSYLLMPVKARFKSKAKQCRVKKSIRIFVSTVFLGIDHSYSDNGEPILFETMTFGGNFAYYQERCCTWEEAELMHEKAVNMVQDAINVINK